MENIIRREEEEEELSERSISEMTREMPRIHKYNK
jgi:hypothetical protein